MPNDSRTRMVRSAALLIRTRGVNATSFSEVLADSGAPRGSIYHHFPAGKAELAVAAMHSTSEWVLGRQRACPAADPAGVLECFIDLWRQVVVGSQGAAGCVVAGVAIDTTAEEPALIDTVRATFRSWVALLAEQLGATGLTAPHAQSVALTTLAAMEGALILCRAEGSVLPLETVASQLGRLVPGAVR